MYTSRSDELGLRRTHHTLASVEPSNVAASTLSEADESDAPLLLIDSGGQAIWKKLDHTCPVSGGDKIGKKCVSAGDDKYELLQGGGRVGLLDTTCASIYSRFSRNHVLELFLCRDN